MPETKRVSPPPRFDLEPLEFEAVRGLLRRRLATPLGHRAVDALAPLAAAEPLRRILQCAAELAVRLAADDPTPLVGVTEVRSWLGPFFDGEHVLGTRDLADLRRLLRAAERCRHWVATRADQPALIELGAGFPVVADLTAELDSVVDARGEVLSTASAKLAAVRREIDAAEDGVRAAVQRFLRDPAVPGWLQNPEPSWRHGRPVFQVRQEHRHRISGVLHDRSQSGATLFVEPSVVVEAANTLSDARAAEQREIQVVLARISRGLRRCQADIEAAVRSLAELDLTTARARLIHEDGFCKPEITTDGELRIRGGRHPILLDRDAADGDVVPLDVALGDPHHLLVVTGPNTGGKTVVLKTIGLLALMALCGVPVPADTGTRIPLFDGVFADIGDEQGISQNLSTFSSHVARIARCLRHATENSLVLLDELGAGTDPEEGGALGYAVLELLERRRACAAVTTHLGQLKHFAYQHAGAENGSMAFDAESLRPLFRLEVGIPGCSHALDIAGQVGMPAELVTRARALLGRRDHSMEEAVQRVQETRRRAEEDRQRTARAARSAEQTEEQVREELTALERRQVWLHEEADALVDEQLRRARVAIEATYKQLRNAPKPYSELAAELGAQVSEALGATSIHRRRMVFLGTLRKGSIVYCPRLARRCVVRKVDRVREICTVEVGKVRMEIAFEDVSWLQPLDA